MKLRKVPYPGRDVKKGEIRKTGIRKTEIRKTEIVAMLSLWLYDDVIHSRSLLFLFPWLLAALPYLSLVGFARLHRGRV